MVTWLGWRSASEVRTFTWAISMAQCTYGLGSECLTDAPKQAITFARRAGRLLNIRGMMTGVGRNRSNNDVFCIKNEEFCIKNEKLCIQNDELCSHPLSKWLVPALLSSVLISFVRHASQFSMAKDERGICDLPLLGAGMLGWKTDHEGFLIVSRWR